MTAPLDITTGQRKLILALLRRHLPGVRVWAFGSRVKWTATPSSDLDLVAFAKPVQSRQVANLKEAFDESSLPFRVDFHVWDELPERFHANIQENYVVFLEADDSLTRIVKNGLRLGDVCEKIGSGATPHGGKESYKGGTTTLIRSQNVYNDGFHRAGLVFIGDAQTADLDNVEVKPGDILLNITGDSVARCCQVANDVLPARVNQHVAIIRPRPDALDARYLRYVLVSPLFQNHLLALASAGATRPALTKAMIENLNIPTPPLKCQKAIAAILGALDDKIELNRRMNATLEAMAQVLFKKFFPYSPGDKLPNGWRESMLGEVIDVFDSKRIPLSGRERELRQGPYPYHGAASVMDYVDDFLFDGVYLLMGEDGSVINEDETPVLQYVWGKFWVNNHAHVLRGKNDICTEQLFLYLKSCNIAPFVTGAVQPKLNQGNMNKIGFIVPPGKVAQDFSRAVEPLFAMFRANVEQSKTFAIARDSLLPKLLSGELRVPVAA